MLFSLNWIEEYTVHFICSVPLPRQYSFDGELFKSLCAYLKRNLLLRAPLFRIGQGVCCFRIGHVVTWRVYTSGLRVSLHNVIVLTTRVIRTKCTFRGRTLTSPRLGAPGRQRRRHWCVGRWSSTSGWSIWSRRETRCESICRCRWVWSRTACWCLCQGGWGVEVQEPQPLRQLGHWWCSPTYRP